MSEIQRYDPYYKDDLGYRYEAMLGRTMDGDVVLYSDYLTRVQQLEKRVRELREALKNLMRGGEHDGDCEYLEDHDGDMFCRIHAFTADQRLEAARAALKGSE